MTTMQIAVPESLFAAPHKAPHEVAREMKIAASIHSLVPAGRPFDRTGSRGRGHEASGVAGRAQPPARFVVDDEELALELRVADLGVGGPASRNCCQEMAWTPVRSALARPGSSQMTSDGDACLTVRAAGRGRRRAGRSGFGRSGYVTARRACSHEVTLPLHRRSPLRSPAAPSRARDSVRRGAPTAATPRPPPYARASAAGRSGAAPGSARARPADTFRRAGRPGG
jgi:hypothetical protein